MVGGGAGGQGWPGLGRRVCVGGGASCCSAVHSAGACSWVPTDNASALWEGGLEAGAMQGQLAG